MFMTNFAKRNRECIVVRGEGELLYRVANRWQLSHWLTASIVSNWRVGQ